MKRKRPEEKTKLKDFKNGLPVVKKHIGLPVNKIIGEAHTQTEMPKVTLPKNDDSDKFWASIGPYCSSVTKEDLAVRNYSDSTVQMFKFFSVSRNSYGRILKGSRY